MYNITLVAVPLLYLIIHSDKINEILFEKKKSEIYLISIMSLNNDKRIYNGIKKRNLPEIIEDHCTDIK